jgi:m7GpppX diphosphatase
MITYTDNNRKYTFIPENPWNVEKKELVLSNDVYNTYDAKLSASGKLIECTDIKQKEKDYIIVPETYSEYLDIISKYDFTQDQWVYNILEGKSEQENVLYKDDKIIIMADYKWNKYDTLKMHLLTFSMDQSLRSIRDLTAEHISLLQHIKTKTLAVIKEQYGFDKESIKMYFHYSPSTYLLHVHFLHIKNTECHSSVEYSHGLNNVIANLEIKPDYYQSVDIYKRVE